jgi:sec-independent protein translocase protein TatA
MGEGLFSPTHLIIILIILLIVLGPKRLPEAGRGLGEAIRGFKESISSSDKDDDRAAVTAQADAPSHGAASAPPAAEHEPAAPRDATT